MKRTTKIGVEETMDDPRWQSPAHQVSIEVDNLRGSGTHRKRVAGIKSARFYGTPIGKPLTDRMIGKYVKSGFYDMRHALFREQQREKRLIWNAEKQDFEMR